MPTNENDQNGDVKFEKYEQEMVTLQNGAKTDQKNGLQYKKPTERIPKISYPSRSLRFLERFSISEAANNDSDFLPSQAKLPLEIIIVGGGLGGLATSIAMARRGHSVTVFEQAQEIREVRLFHQKSLRPIMLI